MLHWHATHLLLGIWLDFSHNRQHRRQNITRMKKVIFTYSQLLALAEKSARKSISSDLIKYSDDILRGREDQMQVKVAGIKSSGGVCQGTALKSCTEKRLIHHCASIWMRSRSVRINSSCLLRASAQYIVAAKSHWAVSSSERVQRFPRSTFTQHQVKMRHARSRRQSESKWQPRSCACC